MSAKTPAPFSRQRGFCLHLMHISRESTRRGIKSADSTALVSAAKNSTSFIPPFFYLDRCGTGFRRPYRLTLGRKLFSSRKDRSEAKNRVGLGNAAAASSDRWIEPRSVEGTEVFRSHDASCTVRSYGDRSEYLHSRNVVLTRSSGYRNVKATLEVLRIRVQNSMTPVP